MKKNNVLSCLYLSAATTLLFVFVLSGKQVESSVALDENRRLIESEVETKEVDMSILNRYDLIYNQSDEEELRLFTCMAEEESEDEIPEVLLEEPIEEIELLAYNFTDEEKEILYRIVEAEATDYGITEKKNVCSVIINRVNSEEFPDTIEEVVFQKNGKVYQFAPIKDKRYYKVEIKETTKQAVDEVLKDGISNGKISEALYFCSYSDIKVLRTKKWFKSLTYLLEDKAHSFYKE